MSTSPQDTHAVSHRTVATGLAWSAPAVAAAVAAPAFAASTTTLTATNDPADLREPVLSRPHGLH